MSVANTMKFTVIGRVPGDDDDTVAEIIVHGDQSPANVFIEKILYNGDMPADWTTRQPSHAENSYGEWAYIQNIAGSSDSENEESFLTECGSKLAILPPHSPMRFETADGLDTPHCTNGLRVELASAALKTFQRAHATTEDLDTNAADLIGDLLHLVHASGHQPLSVLESAIGQFLAEAGELPTP